jgi:hypothetical protein
VERKLIGVVPKDERAARGRLFDALEEAFPVRFAGRDPNAHAGLDGVLVLPRGVVDAGAIPDGLARLIAVGEEATAHVAAGPRLRLSGDAPLDRRLRGLRLHDFPVAGAAALAAGGEDSALAMRGDDPVWLSRPAPCGPRAVVAVAPAELAAAEALRDRLGDGRFLAIAALVHFVRAVCEPIGWRPPPLRACFLFDDPNLHWGSYGHLRYRELLRHADRHDYHVALATVPLDGWFAHPAAARLFGSRPDRLSLVMHGNDHTRLELARPAGAADRRALLAQALRRTAAFERRSGLTVDRVMVAPHGVCSREIARDLFAFGFEALCISRPYPWLALPPSSWLERPPESSALAGWEPASVVDVGLPVLLRRPFGAPAEDLALRAFLDQPLILYGHHGDMGHGLDRLAELATIVRRLGDVRWMSVGDIAAGNAATRQAGDVLQVRMFCRRARLPMPAGVQRLVVEAPSLEPHPADAIAWERAGTGTVEVRLRRGDALDPTAIALPARSHWAVARRVLSEGRDRLAPAYRRTAASARRRSSWRTNRLYAGSSTRGERLHAERT